MTRPNPIAFLATAAVVPLAAFAVTGCGGGDNATAAASPPASSPPKPAHARPETVEVANSGLGKILVDARGRTLYLFTKDSSSTSTCTGACTTAWPPLRADGATRVRGGANASMVGTTRRSDGKPQVTYKGHPLYLFAQDQSPGDTNGEAITAFGGSWFAVSPAGNRVASQSSQSGRGSSSRQPAPAAAPPAQKPSPSPSAAPAPKPKPQSNGIPQNGGGDGDADNNGGPDDGDGGV